MKRVLFLAIAVLSVLVIIFLFIPKHHKEKTADDYRIEAEQKLAENNIPEAISAYEHALQQNPGRLDLVKGLIKSLVRNCKNDFDSCLEAEALLDEYILANPLDADLVNLLDSLYVNSEGY